MIIMSKDNKERGLPGGMGLYFLLLMTMAGIAIVWALVMIIVTDGDMWRSKAEAREEEYQIKKARRGNIYSSDGKILATTVPVCDLYLDLGRWQKRDKNGHVVTDTNGRIIIESLIPDSSFTKHIDQVCAILHEAVPSKSTAMFRDKIMTERSKNSPSRCYLIQRQLPYSSWKKICSLEGWKRAVVRHVDGHSIVKEKRAHTYGNMAENVIGFRNAWEDETYTGLEGYYNKVLSGVDGKYLCRRLTRGVWLPVQEGKSYDGNIPVNTDSLALLTDSAIVRPVVDGLDIISTIDTRYQDIAESALRKALTRHNGESGTAILMEMETGYILACSNLARDTHSGAYLELPNRNVAVQDIYEPGSTFKTVVLTAMMNDPNMKVDTAMKLKVGYKRFPGANGEIKDDHTLNGRDTLSLREVIEQSSNVGMSELGWQFYRNRRDTLKHYVEKTFPYRILNLDVKAPEYPGHINDPKRSNRDFLNLCYGYSTSVSAMQLITFYNALGAGGRMVKPLFCRGIVENGKVKPVQPVILNEHICSSETAALVKELLKGVVERGTGNNIRNNAYGIAGKTGTAIHSYKNIKMGRKESRYNASFAGFFPTEHPKYTCLVVLEDVPIFGRQGAEVFKQISDCVMAMDRELGNIRLGDGSWKMKDGVWVKDDNARVRPPFVSRGSQRQLHKIYDVLRLSYLSSDSTARWADFVPATDSTAAPARYVAYRTRQGVVPDCTGMTVKDAIHLLRSCGYGVRFKGVGKVVRQHPQGGTKAASGSTTVVLKLN